jgi:cell wall-associated NlpC family hydrolase
LLLLVCSLVTAAEPTTQPRDPQEIRRGVVMGENREQRAQRVYENIIRKVEPNLVGDTSKLPIYLELFKREFVEDPRQFAIDLTPQQQNGKCSITGYVEFAEHQHSLKEFLHYLSLDQVEDKTDLLPSVELAGNEYATVTVPRCFVYDRKEGKGETLTECLAGDPVFIIRDEGKGRVLGHARSGYVGWIDAESLQRATQEKFDSAINAKPVDPRIDPVIAAAKTLMGVKYVWGGLTKDGIDCSGLVNRSFATVGIVLPRDADQQSLAGTLVATRWHRSALRKGDVLFFLGRRGTISHTAIYLGDNQFIEATDPGVKITSFNPKDENYENRRDEGFAFAKRMIE